jgi:hypothetical protein
VYRFTINPSTRRAWYNVSSLEKAGQSLTMNDSEVIIELGAEGGSVTLYGIRTERGWFFSREVIDSGLMLIDEGPTK